VGQKLFVGKKWHSNLSTKTCDGPQNNLQIK